MPWTDLSVEICKLKVFITTQTDLGSHHCLPCGGGRWLLWWLRSLCVDWVVTSVSSWFGFINP
ncbi:hypothetical protein TSUD_155810 [Trifolium subterraneum]|uniref:Uncharacterized protein n=1 Tax=Trifolium subterraneum TaxID=3900 RepID=A0A2Z6MUR7_TRISU|nr:hypothetical protein TSUD_155810 [Trifolium subterraneum]